MPCHVNGVHRPDTSQFGLCDGDFHPENVVFRHHAVPEESLHLPEVFLCQGESLLRYGKSPDRPPQVVPCRSYRPLHSLGGALLRSLYPLQGKAPGVHGIPDGPPAVDELAQRQGCLPGGPEAGLGIPDLLSSYENGMERILLCRLVEKGYSKLGQRRGSRLVYPLPCLGDTLPSGGQDGVVNCGQGKGFFKGKRLRTIGPFPLVENQEKKAKQEEDSTVHCRSLPEPNG